MEVLIWLELGARAHKEALQEGPSESGEVTEGGLVP